MCDKFGLPRWSVGSAGRKGTPASTKLSSGGYFVRSGFSMFSFKSNPVAGVPEDTCLLRATSSKDDKSHCPHKPDRYHKQSHHAHRTEYILGGE